MKSGAAAGSARSRLGGSLVVAVALLLSTTASAGATPWPQPALGTFFPAVLPACTTSWDGGAGTTSWLDAANWSRDRLPAANDDVCIGAATPAAEVVHGAAALTDVHSVQAEKRVVVSAGRLGVATASKLDTLKLTGGSVDLDGNTEIGELQQSTGDLTGDGVVTLNGFQRTSVWSGGAQRGPGGTVLADGALQITGAAEKALADGRILELKDGTDASWTGGDLTLGTQTQLLIDAGSGLHAQPGAGTLKRAPGGGGIVGSVKDAGAYTVATGLGSTHVVEAPLNATGTVSLSSGSVLELRGGGRQSGTVDFATNSELMLSDGNDVLDGALFASGGGARGKLTVRGTAGAVLDGPAGFTYLVHDLSVAAGKLTLGADASVSKATQSGGELTGQGKLTATASLVWTGGTQSGPGETHVAATAQGGLDGNAVKILSGRALTIAASNGFSWEAGDVELRAAAAIRNAGQFYVASRSGHIRAGPGAGTVVNQPAGRISVLAPASIEVPLDGAHGSTLSVGSDIGVELSLTGGVSHGTVALGFGAIVDMHGYALAADSELTSAVISRLNIVSGVVDVAGTAEISDAKVTGGQLTLAGSPTKIGTLDISGGKVRFAANALVGEVNNDGGDVAVADKSTVTLNPDQSTIYRQIQGSTTLEGASSRIDAAQHPDGVVEIWGGALVGDGVIAGPLTNDGKVGPGNGIGTLTVEGDYTQLPAGTLAIEADAARTDGLAVRGAASLAGTLTLAAPPGFAPPRDGIQVMTTTSRSGSFDTVTKPDNLDIEYRPDGVLLLPASACDAPHGARAGTPRPALLEAINLSRSPTRSLYPEIAAVPGGMGVVWLEDLSGITFRRVGDDGSTGTAIVLDSGAGEYSRWQIAASGRFVYVVWEQRRRDGTPEGLHSEIWLAASRDGGESFSPAVQVSGTPGETSWFPKVAASGEHVSVVWSEGGKLLHAQSNDAGATFPDDARHEVTDDVLPGTYDVAQSGPAPSIGWRGFVALHDGGTVPSGPVFVASNATGGGALVKRSIDETGPASGVPRLAADGDRVYVLFDEGASALRLASSQKGGAWSVSTLAGAADGAKLAAADGTAVVAWGAGGQAFARTSAGGAGFGDAVEIAPGDVEDVATSQGRVHIATRTRQGPWRIVLASSSDGGRTYERSGGQAYELGRLACGTRASLLARVAASGESFAVAWNDIEMIDTPPFYGDYEVGYRSGFLADPDLELTDVHAVQAADGADKLVARKPTVVRATVRSTIPEPRAVTIRVRYQYQGAGGPVDQTVSDSKIVSPGVQRVWLPLSSVIEPEGHELHYVVTVDPADAIPESSDTNNEKSGVQPVKETKPFRVLVVPVHVAGEPPVGCRAASDIAAGTKRYLDAAFPLAPRDTQVDHRCDPIEIEDKRYDDDVIFKVYRPVATAASAAGYDTGIGVVRTDWFRDHSASHPGAVALAPFDAALGTVLTERQATGGWAVAHEIAHNLGWVARGTPGATDHHQNGVPAPGYWVGDRQAVDRIDLMDETEAGADVTSTTGQWIATNTWDYLLGKLAVDPADPPVIAMTGVVGSDGGVDADPWYEFDGTVDAPLGSTGELGVRFLDGDGKVLGTAGFDAMHEFSAVATVQGDGQLTDLPFAIRVPAVAGTQTVQITRGGAVIYERHRSAHAPAVAVTQPDAGAALRPGDKVPATWSSSDADGDALTHLVQLSTDGGQTWLPLGEDITGSAFTFTVPATAAVSTARLRVIATDGLNTTAALSPEFTIGEAAKIAFDRFDQGLCRHQLWVINTDGSDMHKLSSCEQVDGLQIEDSDPSWSTDGRQIAFERYDGCCDASIYVMNADGSGAHVVIDTPGSWAESPDWSPRSDEIVFETTGPLPEGGLNVVRSDGSGRRPLGVFGFKPSWSPDGTKIAYILNSALRIIDADGSGDHAVPGPFVDEASAPSWSPDGARIAFTGESDEAIYVMNAEGGDVHKLPERGFDAAWSPGGDALAFSCRCPQRDFKLHTMRPDGSDLTPLTDITLAEEYQPDWQPVVGEPVPLTVDAGGPYAVAEGERVPMTAVASGGGSASYAWDLDGDGQYDDAGGATAAATFPDDGAFTVGVRARDNANATATDTAPVAVSNVAPSIVVATATIDERQDGRLHAEVTDPGVADALTATVDWGDGTPTDDVPLVRDGGSFVVEAPHSYAAPGSYSVTLTVADDDGGHVSSQLPVTSAPANRAPFAEDRQVETPVGVPVALELAAVDPDGDHVGLRVISGPAHGRVVALPSPEPTPLPGEANFVYTPDGGFSGADRFTYVANDGLLDSAVAEVSVTVGVVQPPPGSLPTVGSGSGPGPAPGVAAPAGTAAQLLLACSGRDVALIDVLPSGRRRVLVTGVARVRLAGRKVAILLDGRRVGTTTVSTDGRFAVVVRAPARSRRPRARYQARIGTAVSGRLRLQRRMIATAVRVRAGRGEFRGLITAPFARHPAPILLERFRTCTARERVDVGRILPDHRGHFVIRFAVPTGSGPALYRARTKVAVHRRGRATKWTFTLPQPVDP